MVNARALRAMRIEAGFTLTELGKLAGVSLSHVSRIEAGHRTHPALGVTKALAKALNCPISTLLAFEQEGAQV